jgi:lysophospholipase L1-like esterase
MAYTNILSRRLNIECVNLGFSGNGRGEPEVAEAIAQIANPACFVLDYEANAGSGGILERTLPGFIGILRKDHPEVPVLVVSKIGFAEELYNCEAAGRKVFLRDYQRNMVEDLRRNGDENIHFLDGIELLGDSFDECTVDGVHPTDLGFWRMAEKLEPVIRKLLP